MESTEEGEGAEPVPNAELLEIARLNERLVACQQHYESLLQRQKEDNAREKQSTVMRYAQAEKAKLDSDKRAETLLSKNNDLNKEREGLQVKLAEFKLMNGKLQQAYESKLSELSTTKKDLEKVKELNQSIDATLKSTLNHLKGESQQLREQREMNERLKKDLQEQQEWNKQLSETVQAIPTDEERTEAFDTLLTEHNGLKVKLTNIQEENQLIREKLKAAEEDRLALENVIESFRHTALKEKETTKKFYEDLLAAREQDSNELSRLKQIEVLHNQTLADNADLRQLLEKEHQLLTLTQTLTEKNSVLQSDFEQAQLAFKQLSDECQTTSKVNDEQRRRLTLAEETERSSSEQLKALESKYHALTKSYEQIFKENEDSRSELVTLKKKHQANTKDLIKQLQQLQKTKVTPTEDVASSSQSKSQTGENGSSRGSRTSSVCSLNDSPPVNVSTSEAPHAPVPPDDEPEVIVNIVDIDRQKLIDKLIKQQRLLVRRNEKIEFLNDHIQLLTQDLQNKRRIIQSYAMHEEGFMYTSNESDSIKQQLAQKNRHHSSSLMATLYNRATTAGQQATTKLLPQFFHDPSSHMTLETALDIMGKLQAVLEDTLLKNLTLKENVDTLSQEIDRLSKRTMH